MRQDAEQMRTTTAATAACAGRTDICTLLTPQQRCGDVRGGNNSLRAQRIIDATLYRRETGDKLLAQRGGEQVP